VRGVGGAAPSTQSPTISTPMRVARTRARTRTHNRNCGGTGTRTCDPQPRHAKCTAARGATPRAANRRCCNRRGGEVGRLCMRVARTYTHARTHARTRHAHCLHVRVEPRASDPRGHYTNTHCTSSLPSLPNPPPSPLEGAPAPPPGRLRPAGCSSTTPTLAQPGPALAQPPAIASRGGTRAAGRRRPGGEGGGGRRRRGGRRPRGG
jgi:hypothetical protein